MAMYLRIHDTDSFATSFSGGMDRNSAYELMTLALRLKIELMLVLLYQSLIRKSYFVRSILSDHKPTRARPGESWIRVKIRPCSNTFGLRLAEE